MGYSGLVSGYLRFPSIVVEAFRRIPLKEELVALSVQNHLRRGKNELLQYQNITSNRRQPAQQQSGPPHTVYE